MSLSPLEHDRYRHQMILEGWGEKGQQRLKDASVLVVGAGGLGCPLLLYLAAAGVGTLGVCDGDSVSLTNLHRQILFHANDVGKNKATLACEKLSQYNPHVRCQPYPWAVTRENVSDLLAPYDCIADASDRFSCKYLLNDACVVAGKPLVSAAAERQEGRVLALNCPTAHGELTASLRCIFPEPPHSAARCSEVGVLGAVTGVVGSFQAQQILELLVYGCLQKEHTLFLFAPHLSRLTALRARRVPEVIALTQIQDSQHYNLLGGCERMNGNDIEVEELSVLLQANSQDLTLIDVREAHERDLVQIGGIHIPLGELERRFHEIPRRGTVVVYCRSGGRSAKAIEFLEKNHQYSNLRNLIGGILAWAQRIDPSLPQY